MNPADRAETRGKERKRIAIIRHGRDSTHTHTDRHTHTHTDTDRHDRHERKNKHRMEYEVHTKHHC